MKNSEFLNLLETSGKVNNVWGRIVKEKRYKVDTVDLNMCKFYNKMERLGCDIIHILGLINNMIDTRYNKESIKEVEDFLDFVLNTTVEEDGKNELLLHIVDYYDAGDYNMLNYNDWYGERININGEVLEVFERWDGTVDFVKNNRIIYKDVSYIEKDLGSDKVEVKSRDNSVRLIEKGKIKIFFGKE